MNRTHFHKSDPQRKTVSFLGNFTKVQKPIYFIMRREKNKRRYDASVKGVIMRKGVISRSEKALLRISFIKSRNNAFLKGVITRNGKAL